VFISDGVLVPDILRKKNSVTLGGARKGSANKNTSTAAGIIPSHPIPFFYVTLPHLSYCISLPPYSFPFQCLFSSFTFLIPTTSQFLSSCLVVLFLAQLGSSTSTAVGTAGIGKLPFVYPYGASLSVERPARPLLSSGPVSYPLNRPIAAMWETETVMTGTTTATTTLTIHGFYIYTSMTSIIHQ